MADYGQQIPREQMLSLVHEFATVISSSLMLEETLSLIAQRTAEAVDAWECDLYEYSPQTNTLTGTAFWSRDPRHADLEWVGTVVDLSARPAYGRILLDKQVVEDHVDDPEVPESESRLMAAWGEMTTIAVPLVFRGEAIGCLVIIEKRAVRHFTDDETALLKELAVPAAIAIHNARTYRSQEDRSRQLAALLEAGRAMTSSLLLDDVLDQVAESAAETLASPECLIYEFDAENDVMTARSFYTRPGHSTEGFDPELGRSYPLDEYPGERALLSGGIAVEEHVSDETVAEDVLDSMREYNEQTVLTVPLAFHSEPLGLLLLIETERERRFTPDEIDLVCGLGEQAAVAIHNARLFRRREEQNRRLVSLLHASQAITGSLDATEVVSRVTAEVDRLLPGSRTTTEVWLRIDEGLFLPFQPDRSLQPGQLPDGSPAGHGEMVRRPDELAVAAIRRLGPVQMADDLGGHRLVVPLVLNRNCEGYLDLSSQRLAPFSEDEIQIVQLLVTHAGIALENADNYGRLETTYLETVTALAAAMEAKDHYTAEHADMLAAMAVSVGRQFGFSETELRELQYAAVLHDIGKIGIPGHILNKPDRLTKEEFETMAQHTIIGQRIISRIEYLEPIATIIRAAHERWDGGGYPDGVEGEDIPLASRILLVCDAYHAMTSDRPYRTALSEEVALREVGSNAGTQFDPKVVDMFLNVHPHFETDDAEPRLQYQLQAWQKRKRGPSPRRKRSV